MSRTTLLACTAALAAGFMTTAHATDAIFAANAEAAPDCTSIGAPGCPGLVFEVPPIEVQGGQSISYCYDLTWPNAPALGIARFSSTADPLVEQMMVYVYYSEALPPPGASPWGSLSGCGDGMLDPLSGSAGSTVPVRIYQAHGRSAQLRMPYDDGNGHPVALPLGGGSPIFVVQMYLVNPGPDPVTTIPLRFTANGLGAGVAYTKTASLTALATTFQIAPHSSAVVTRACPVPDAAKFWWFSTHSHSRATNATLRDGANVIVSSNDWDAPSVATFAAPAFYQFAAPGSLTYECAFANGLDIALPFGHDYQTTEQCDALAYFFPAPAGPQVCFDDSVF